MTYNVPKFSRTFPILRKAQVPRWIQSGFCLLWGGPTPKVRSCPGTFWFHWPPRRSLTFGDEVVDGTVDLVGVPLVLLVVRVQTELLAQVLADDRGLRQDKVTCKNKEFGTRAESIAVGVSPPTKTTGPKDCTAIVLLLSC